MPVVATAAVFLLLERPAYAYIDPGTGSLIYQTVLTLILGLGLGVRRWRDSIVMFFKRLGGRDAAQDHTSSDSN
jgi:hypothetical protein